MLEPKNLHTYYTLEISKKKPDDLTFELFTCQIYAHRTWPNYEITTIFLETQHPANKYQ